MKKGMPEPRLHQKNETWANDESPFLEKVTKKWENSLKSK